MAIQYTGGCKNATIRIGPLDFMAEKEARARREQIISFAYGNVHLHNPAVTREMIAAEYDKLYPTLL